MSVPWPISERAMRITLKLYATLTDYLPPAARPQNLVRMDVPEEATIDSNTAVYKQTCNDSV